MKDSIESTVNGTVSLLNRYTDSLNGSKKQISKVVNMEKKLVTLKKVFKSSQAITKETFKTKFHEKKWYLTKQQYSTFLTGLYYLKYSTYEDAVNANMDNLDQFYKFYSKILSFIGHYHLYTKGLPDNDETNEEQIAQVEFMKFMNKITKSDACIIKNSPIEIANYTKPTAVVKTNVEQFKKNLSYCKQRLSETSKKKLTNPNVITSMLLYDEESNEGHANTLIISHKKKSVWRIEPNSFYYIGRIFYDYLDKALIKFFNDNPDLELKYKGLYPYALKSTPTHAGLCVLMSVIQIYFPRDISYSNVKYYIIKFFEDQFHLIYNTAFDLSKDTNNRLIDVIKYLHKVYRIHDFEINNEEATSIKKILKRTEPLESIKEIVGKHYKGDVILDEQNAKGYTEPVTERKTKKTSFDFI